MESKEAEKPPAEITTKPDSVVEFWVDPMNRPRRSKDLDKIAEALAKAQGEIENAEKDGKGTYGSYSTLAATWNVIRKPLSKHGISVYQRPMISGTKMIIGTMLLHSSGQFIDDSDIELRFENNGRMNVMQALGSAITYARRYSLQGATGVAPEDDDGRSIEETDNRPKTNDNRARQAQPIPKSANESPKPKTTAMPAKAESQPVAVSPDAKATKAMLKELGDLAVKRGWATVLCTRYIKHFFQKTTSADLTIAECASMLEAIKTSNGFETTQLLDQMEAPK